jgi:hypothetical protein
VTASLVLTLCRMRKVTIPGTARIRLILFFSSIDPP